MAKNKQNTLIRHAWWTMHDVMLGLKEGTGMFLYVYLRGALCRKECYFLARVMCRPPMLILYCHGIFTYSWDNHCTFCTYFWKVFLNSLISGMENSLNSEYTDCETFAGAISPSFLCCWRFNFEVSSESAMAYWGGGVGSVETQHWGRDRDTVNNLSKSSAYSCLIKILTYLQLLPPLFTTSPVHLSWFTGSIHLSWFTASNLHFPIKSWRRGNKKRGRGIVLVGVVLQWLNVHV